MRLTVGSGPHYAESWTNLDLNNDDSWFHQPDILGSIFDLPFDNDSVDQCYLGHILEHLEWEMVPLALFEVKRVCKTDGIICVVGPCLEKAVLTNQPDWLLQEIPKGWDQSDKSGFPHAWTATTLLTKVALERGGLSDIIEVPITTITKPEWPNPEPGDPVSGSGMWQCAFLARP